MKERNELKELYEIAVQVKPSMAMRMLQEAQTEEERKFYAFVANMNLQRAQKEAIERNAF